MNPLERMTQDLNKWEVEVGSNTPDVQYHATLRLEGEPAARFAKTLLATGYRLLPDACLECEMNPGLCDMHGTQFREPFVLSEERLAEAIHQARKHPGTAERAVQWDRILARRTIDWLRSHDA